MKPGSHSRLGAVLFALALLGAAPALAQDRSGVDTALPSYGSFLDSLRSQVEPLSSEGIEETWVAADSVEALIIEQGPAFADTAESAVFRSWNLDLEPALVDFNRVEGLRLGALAGVRYGEHEIDGAGAYGFSNKEWRWRTRASIGLGPGGELDVQYGDLIEAYGQAPVEGNGVYAFIAGADDQDYVRRRAFEIGIERDLSEVEFYVGYQESRESSVEAITDWNLFARKRGPRPNPPINEGTVRRFKVRIDGKWVAPSLQSALFKLRIASDVGGYAFGGDFDYDRHLVELDTDLRGIYRDDMRLRLAAGAARNGPPTQDLHYLGGPRFLRAYGVHELQGDRMLGASLDYFVGIDLLGFIGMSWAELQFVPFAEIGAAWFDPNGTGLFSKPSSSDWKSNAGLGFKRNIMLGASARGDVAFRLDRDVDRFTWRFRFEMPLFDRL